MKVVELIVATVVAAVTVKAVKQVRRTVELKKETKAMECKMIGKMYAMTERMYDDRLEKADTVI